MFLLVNFGFSLRLNRWCSASPTIGPIQTLQILISGVFFKHSSYTKMSIPALKIYSFKLCHCICESLSRAGTFQILTYLGSIAGNEIMQFSTGKEIEYIWIQTQMFYLP